MNPYGDGAGPAKLITDQYLSDLRLTRSLAWASYSVLVYDYLITFNDEVQLIWKANPSRVKNIFLANRYGNLILQGIMSAQTGGVFRDDAISFCFSLTLVAGISMFLSYASIHVLVLLRVWAVWGRRKYMFVLLATGFFIYSVVSISVLIWGIVWGGYYAYPGSTVTHTCVGTVPSWGWTLWLPSVLLECGMFGLTMYILSNSQTTLLFRRSPIVRTLFRDGIIYFIFSTFSSLFNISIWVKYYYGPKNMLAYSVSLSLVSVIGQRLVMDLRMIDRASLALSRDERGGQMPGEEYVPPNSPIMFDLNMIPMISKDTALDEEVGSHTVPDEK